MPPQHPPISRAELFSLLARGLEARATVLTPNRRLAQVLTQEHDRLQLAQGRGSWEAPEILTFGDFVRRGHDEALYSPGGAQVPALLSAIEEQVLWEDAVRSSRWRDKLLSTAATAALAAEAWRLAHQWRIEGALDGWAGNEDIEAFAAWRAHYLRRTERDALIDLARLPALIAPLFASGAASVPAKLVLYAFDLLTPQQADFLDACARAGVQVLECSAPRLEGKVKRAVFESPRQELEFAARWARARLDARSSSAEGRGEATPRIAIVVPELSKRRAEVTRVFSRTLGSRFNVSLAPPLSAAPMVDAALALLELAAGPVAFDRASRLLRTPFIGGSETEHAARSRLDAALRRLAPATISAARLRALIPEAAARRGAPPCRALTAALDRLIAAAGDTSRAPAHDWARRFTTILDAAGFPGERVLDSAEYQTLAKWREVLASFATLGSVAPTWDASEARSRLQRLCGETLFQPASGEAAVQVLGILESTGMAFDHLWISGLTEEAWPLAPRPQPLIPPALQRQAGIPQATPERSLAVDRALTQAWLGAAPEVMLSSARAEGDREMLPSPLVADVAVTAIDQLAIPAYLSRRDALYAAGRVPGAMTTRTDNLGPPLLAAQAAGGTAILADQAACPFRAFAHYRLDARALERPEPGLGPPERGALLHEMMARLWSSLKDQRTLLATDPARLAELIDEAAAHAVARVRADRPGRLEGRFAVLERERLAGLAREWLEIERERAPFEVRLREEKMALFAGNLRLEGRVDRIDRIEDGGGLAVIDYKSGAVSVASWLGARPDDPQLPLYALAAGDEVCAVAFARLKVGKLCFTGLSRETGLLPDVRTVEKNPTARKFAASWSALLAQWRAETAKLGENFAAGDARVDPKRALATCERCDLQPLCRVHERLGTLDEGDGFEEESPE